MPVVRTSERCARVIRETLATVVPDTEEVEWDLCTSWVDWVCDGHEDDDDPEAEHEAHNVHEQVLCLWISLAAPETESSSTCQWVMPLRAASSDYVASSVVETWNQLSFARRAYELQGDLDLDNLAEQLDDGFEPGP